MSIWPLTESKRDAIRLSVLAGIVVAIVADVVHFIMHRYGL